MMLEKYIYDLLYRYQCVTVPGFGAFITENVSAQINGRAATFLPPRKVITFNANIKNNDGLLANHVASNENVSFEVALNKIQIEVTNWIAELNQRNSITLKNIGSIATIGEEKAWIFEPSNTTNFLVSSFGLNQLISPEIKREIVTLETKTTEVVVEKEPISIAPIPEIKKDYSYLKYAASLALFVTVGLFSYKFYNDDQVAKQTLLVQKNVQNKVHEQIQQATFFIETPNVAVELPITEEKLPYHLIAGAFRSEENAEKALQMLIDQGFKAQKLDKNKYDLYPVAYGSYATLEEAEMEKQKLKRDVDAEAWLLID
ncbi:MAG: HU-CCDC81 and SPOR domain-containing protein [Flavobacteriaceae bacterium]|nr:HU-CCDC81 and SPOR domain-containing protein [Flavobacteriaceae bacterium]